MHLVKKDYQNLNPPSMLRASFQRMLIVVARLSFQLLSSKAVRNFSRFSASLRFLFNSPEYICLAHTSKTVTLGTIETIEEVFTEKVTLEFYISLSSFLFTIR